MRSHYKTTDTKNNVKHHTLEHASTKQSLSQCILEEALRSPSPGCGALPGGWRLVGILAGLAGLVDYLAEERVVGCLGGCVASCPAGALAV